MKKYTKQLIYWWIDLPKFYFDNKADNGLLFGHSDDFPEFHPFSGDWDNFNNEEDIAEGIVHTFIDVISSEGKRKRIFIPKGQGSYYCFTDFSDFPELALFPSIFEAQTKLVCYSHCTCNWDGLSNSRLITVDIDSGHFYNQRWCDDWLNLMREKIPNIGDDVDFWSNGALQLYLNKNEDMLLIHADDSGRNEAALIFKWISCAWQLNDIIPGSFPSHNELFKDFRIGSNSLTRRFA
jgi:hypothetical protein